MRGRQLVRQWHILRALTAARYGLTVAALWRDVVKSHGEATMRTVYRDIEGLRHAGFPVYADGNRWHLVPARTTQDLLEALASARALSAVADTIAAASCPPPRQTR